MTEHLAGLPAASRDRYILLDAQDWMTDEQLGDLWAQITRTARPGARILFRTAGEADIIPGRVPDPIVARWRYQAEASRHFTTQDRSAIYGGVHLYVLADG
jgi:S-adenosylmethionine-diacylglycerol 3-amino-3-carboxypropyl transferase